MLDRIRRLLTPVDHATLTDLPGWDSEAEMTVATLAEAPGAGWGRATASKDTVVTDEHRRLWIRRNAVLVPTRVGEGTAPDGNSVWVLNPAGGLGIYLPRASYHHIGEIHTTQYFGDYLPLLRTFYLPVTFVLADPATTPFAPRGGE